MAAFAAAPMPYRNFAASTTGIPVVAAESAAVNHSIATEHPVAAAPAAAAFPLLMAALPDIFQFSMPPLQVALASDANISSPAALEETKLEPATAETSLLNVLRKHPPGKPLAAEQP